MLQARFTRRIPETGNRVRLAPVECTPQPDDRVNARLRELPRLRRLASATYKRDAIYPADVPAAVLFFPE